MTRPHWARGIMITLILAIGVLPLIPLNAESDDEDAFSTDLALRHIEELARAPHPMGSTESRRVQQVIVDELTGLGLQPETQPLTAPDYFGAPGRTVEVVNVMARINGSSSSGAVALMGHYDTVPSTAGANDNASAVAVMLDVARVLAASEPLANDVIFLFTDGEEPAPKFGSQPFVDSHPWFDDIAFVINLEALGSAGPSMVTDINGPAAWTVDQYAQSVPRPAAFSFITAITALIGGSNTDLAPFRDAGVPGIEFAYFRGSSIYHTPADDIDAVGQWSLTQHGANALALVEHLGVQDFTTAQPDSSTVFFTVGPGWVVHHRSAWLFAAVAVSGLVLALVGWRRRRGLIREIGGVTARVAAVMVAFTALWIPLASWRSDMRVVESSAYLVGFAVVAVLASRYRRGTGTATTRPVAVAAVWLVLATLTLLIPGLGYLFVWPTFIMTLFIGYQWAIGRPLAKWEEFVGLGLVWLTVLTLLVPAIEFFFNFANPRPGNLDSQMLWTMVLPAMLLSLVAELVHSSWPWHEAVETPTERPIEVPALT